MIHYSIVMFIELLIQIFLMLTKKSIMGDHSVSICICSTNWSIKVYFKESPFFQVNKKLWNTAKFDWN